MGFHKRTPEYRLTIGTVVIVRRENNNPQPFAGMRKITRMKFFPRHGIYYGFVVTAVKDKEGVEIYLKQRKEKAKIINAKYRDSFFK